MATITNDEVYSNLDVKRFYLPGITLKDICPGCGAECVRELGEDYLPYPVVNQPFPIHMYCCEFDCGEEWDINVVLSFSLTLASEEE